MTDDAREVARDDDSLGTALNEIRPFVHPSIVARINSAAVQLAVEAHKRGHTAGIREGLEKAAEVAEHQIEPQIRKLRTDYGYGYRDGIADAVKGIRALAEQGCSGE